MKKSFREDDTINVYHVSKAEKQNADAEDASPDMTVYEEEGETGADSRSSSDTKNNTNAAAAETKGYVTASANVIAKPEETEAETTPAETAATAESTAVATATESIPADSNTEAVSIETAEADDTDDKALTAEKMENVSVEQGVIPEAAAETEFGKKEIEKKEEAGETAEITTISVMTGSFSYFVVEVTTLEKILVASDGNTYKITVSYSAEAEIPADAELQVIEITEEEAAEYREWAADALQWSEQDHVFYNRFFDITILSDGEEIQPAAPVSVTVELMDGQLDENPDVDGAELA